MKKHPDSIIMDIEIFGPEIMERKKYIKNILIEHLLNKDRTYLQISKELAKEILEDFAEKLRDLISFYHECDLGDELKVYFFCEFEQMKGRRTNLRILVK